MNKELGGGMKLEGGVARGSNAAAVKTDNLFTGGVMKSPPPTPIQREVMDGGERF